MKNCGARRNLVLATKCFSADLGFKLVLEYYGIVRNFLSLRCNDQ